MDEARRFIRYVFPGLSSLLFFVLFCALSDRSRVDTWFHAVTGDVADSLGAALAVFVVSGAIGYLISVTHHLAYWALYARVPALGLFADQRKVIKDAYDRGDLRLVEQASGIELKKEVVHALSIKGAWIIASSIWHSKKGEEKGFEFAEQRSTTLFDIMHGAGALFIGGVLAALMWVVLECCDNWVCNSSIVLVFAILLCLVLAYNLRITVSLCPTVSDNMLSNYLADHKAKAKGKALDIVVERSLFQ